MKCNHLYSIVINYEDKSITCCYCYKNLNRDDIIIRARKMIKYHGKYCKGGALSKGGVWDYWITLHPEDRNDSW